MKKLLLLTIAGAFLLAATLCWGGIPHLINYQGMLTQSDGKTPVPDGQYSLTFKIYGSESGTDSLWREYHYNMQVTTGLFNVILGSVTALNLAFDTDYWLGIRVGTDPELSPRIRLTSVGYAYRAQWADTASYAQTVNTTPLDSRYVNEGQANSIDSGMIKDHGLVRGDVVANFKAPYSDTADYAKSASGAPGSYAWSFRITDTADTTLITSGKWGLARQGNLLYGNADSTHVNLGVACTTGTSGQNRKYCTVGGGLNNSAGDIGSTVCGGRLNIASNDDATVGGGAGNTAIGPWTTIGGGGENTASNSWSTIGGGTTNIASQLCATVGGGYHNTASGYWANVGGGGNNTATDTSATVGGGKSNSAGSTYTTIGGGLENTANSIYATIGGGYSNSASDYRTTIAGGYNNTASDFDATVGGGYNNTAGGARATISGGWDNLASGTSATVGGGERDTASNTYATVGGGYHNNVSGSGATIAGGYQNKVAGDYSFAVGRQVNLTSDADYTFAFGNNFTTSASHAVVFYDAANPIQVGIGVTDPQAELEVYQSVRVRNMFSATGTNVVITTDGYLRKESSSKRYKGDIRKLKIFPEEIFKLQPVSFKWKTTGEEDIGLIAEDVENVIPDLVIYDSEGKPDAVKYDKVAIYLLDVVKMLKVKNEELEKRIKALESGE